MKCKFLRPEAVRKNYSRHERFRPCSTYINISYFKKNFNISVIAQNESKAVPQGSMLGPLLFPKGAFIRTE